MDCSSPGSSVRDILQARILEWVAIPLTKGSSQSRDRTYVSHVSCTAGGFFTAEPPGKPLYLTFGVKCCVVGSEDRSSHAGSGCSSRGSSDSELRCWGVPCSKLYQDCSNAGLAWVLWLALDCLSYPPVLKGSQKGWEGSISFPIRDIKLPTLCNYLGFHGVFASVIFF